MEQKPKKIRFHFIKGNYYRVIRVEGVHGGLTPHGHIFAALFNERAPIPQVTSHTMNQDGSLGEEIMDERETKDGFVREVEVGVMMDLAAAEGFHKWLGEKIAQLKKFSSGGAGEDIT